MDNPALYALVMGAIKTVFVLFIGWCSYKIIAPRGDSNEITYFDRVRFCIGIFWFLSPLAAMPRAEFNDIEFWGQIVAADIGIVPFALIIGIWFPFKGEKKAEGK